MMVMGAPRRSISVHVWRAGPRACGPVPARLLSGGGSDGLREFARFWKHQPSNEYSKIFGVADGPLDACFLSELPNLRFSYK